MKLSALVPPLGKSKYELAIVAAREARRLNDWVRRSGEVLHAKVTAVALDRTIRDEVPYYYDDPSLHQPLGDEMLSEGMSAPAGELAEPATEE